MNRMSRPAFAAFLVVVAITSFTATSFLVGVCLPKKEVQHAKTSGIIV